MLQPPQEPSLGRGCVSTSRELGAAGWEPGQGPMECWGNIPAVNRAPGEEPGLFPSETSLKRKGRENVIVVMKNVEFQMQTSCSSVDIGTLQSWI